MNAQGTPAPGWYTDPSGRHERRWWDGASWRDAVIDNGVRSDDPLYVPDQQVESSTAQGANAANAHSGAETPATQSELADPADAKVTVFSARKIASSLQAETKNLRQRVIDLEAIAKDFGGLEVAEIAQRLRELRDQEVAQKQRFAEAEQEAHRELANLQDSIAGAKATLCALERDTIVVRDRIDLEAKGLYDYEHVAESSARLSVELTDIRSEIKKVNSYDQAIHSIATFTFNNSQAKGKTFVNQMRRIMLRAYNAEAENAVKTVKTGNLAPAIKRLTRAKEQIEKQGTMINLSVDNRYHRLRMHEIELAAKHHQAVAAEKALERERREELREQRKAEQELAAEKERLEKERSHYENSIQRLRDAGDDAAADVLQAKLSEIEDAILQADYRAANIRAGYVYVISNIGAFGEGVVKIGMTRRLDPMDRVRELGDASVPFRFDVHALFFADDAVGIEAALHREFAAQRINQVNTRKEFFRVPPSAVLESLRQQKVSVLEFRTDAEAEEYRTSRAILSQRQEATHSS